MFIIGNKANRSLAISAALLLAAGFGALYAPFAVEAFCWKNPPGVGGSQAFQMLLLTLPLALIAGGIGSWVGFLTAADRRPRPAWRAAWRAVGLWIGVCVVFALMLSVFAILLIPLCAGAAGLSGLASAFIRSKGNHGQT